MKKLVKLFIIAVLAVCGVSCELFGGLINGGNNNGENGENNGNGSVCIDFGKLCCMLDFS